VAASHSGLSPRLLIVNEWILSDLDGANGPEHQRQGATLLEGLAWATWQLVVLRNSPWMAKAWSLMKLDRPLERGLSKQLHSLLRDSSRCLLVTETQPLAAAIAERIPRKDHYLVELALSLAAPCLLVTTDDDLAHGIRYAQLEQIGVQMRSEFIKSFL
jgi:hypothetical protein